MSSLPALPPHPSVSTSATHDLLRERVTLGLPTPLAHTLTQIAETHGVSLGSLVSAAFEVVLYKYTGQADLVVDSSVAFSSLLRSCAERTEVRRAFDASAFEQATSDRVASHLDRILQVVTSDPEIRVRDIDLLTETERKQILYDFNATARPYPRDATIHQLFQEQAWRTPDAVAVVDGCQQLTYRELSAQASRLALRLRRVGVTVGQPVGLIMPRTPKMVVAMLAILEAGGAYVPVDPAYPSERVEFILADSGAAAAITTRETAPDLRFGGPVLLVDGHADADTSEVGTSAAAASTDLAYIMYTSGTTGQPKGVEISHRGVVRLVRGADYVSLGPQTRILATGAIVFDAATFELWGALLNGGSVCLVDNDIILSAPALGEAIVEHSIDTMWLTSPLFNQLVDQDPTIFRPLRQLLIGGDALSARHVHKAMQACPDVTIINGYGPTENTTFSTTHVLAAGELDRIPIGRPIANSTAYVINRDGQLCPVGVAGELFLGGDGLAAGYRGRDELTLAAFVPNPFVPNTRLYRSGDVARWRSDGALEFFGRRDHQVKVRGFRIELGEIEKTMLTLSAVREAVVVARMRANGADKYLSAYYATADVLTPDELHAYLRTKLPDHMVPSYLVELEAIPLNQNGKVDRAALPEPDGLVRASTLYVAPHGPIQDRLVALAECALGIRGIGVTHNLRELGIDSLSATLLAAGIEQAFGTCIPVGQILRDATLEQLALRLPEPTPESASLLPRAPSRASYPLAPQQKRMFVEQLKDETATHYNVPLSFDLSADIDTHRLAGAFERLTARHDALRMECAFVDGDVRQRISPSVRLPLDLVDGASPPVAKFVRPFDLMRGPLWRGGIYRTDDHVHVQLDFHHIVIDGASLGVLFEELLALYDDPSGGSLTDPPLQYRDYADWTASEAGSAHRDEHGAHWRRSFVGYRPSRDLPIDRPRPPIRALDGDVLEFDIGPQRAAALRQLAREENITLFATLASAVSVFLARLTSDTNVTLGAPVSGRHLPGLDRTIGMFANTVCLRTDVRPGMAFLEVLHQVAQTADAAFSNQDFAFEDLVATVGQPRDYSRNPMFDTLIALHSRRYLQVDVHGTPVPLRLHWNRQAVFDLNLQVYETDKTLKVSWQYGSRLFRRSTIERWRDELLQLIDTVLADPRAAIGPTSSDIDFDL